MLVTGVQSLERWETVLSYVRRDSMKPLKKVVQLGQLALRAGFH